MDFFHQGVEAKLGKNVNMKMRLEVSSGGRRIKIKIGKECSYENEDRGAIGSRRMIVFFFF